MSATERLDDRSPHKQKFEAEHTLDGAASPVKALIFPEDVEGISSANVSENVDDQGKTLSKSEDHCLESVIMGDVTSSSSCTPKTFDQSNNTGGVYSVEHLSDPKFKCFPLSGHLEDNHLEPQTIARDENEGVSGFENDCLESGKFSIVERNEVEIDQADTANDEVRETSRGNCSSSVNNDISSDITNKETNESITPACEVANSYSVDELAGRKYHYSVKDEEEINVEHVSSVEKECYQQLASPGEEFLDQGTEKYVERMNSDDEKDSAGKDATSDKFVGIVRDEQTDSTGNISAANEKVTTQIYANSDESGSKCSSESSDLRDGDVIGEPDVVFLDFKTKEPLDVVDLISDSDLEESKSALTLTVNDCGDDVSVSGLESESAKIKDWLTERHLTKKERLRTKKFQVPQQRICTTLMWSLPNFAKKGLLCLNRPPPHLLPRHVRPNREMYLVDSMMSSGRKCPPEKQRSGKTNSSNVPVHKRAFGKSGEQSAEMNAVDVCDASHHSQGSDSIVYEIDEYELLSSSSEVGSPHSDGNSEQTGCDNNEDRLRLSDSILLASLMEMIESAKNASYHQSTFDGITTTEKHSSKRKYGETANTAFSYAVEQNVSRDFFSEALSSGLQTSTLHSSSCAGDGIGPVIPHSDTSEVQRNDETEYPHKRCVIVQETSDMLVCTRTDTNSDQDTSEERYALPRTRWKNCRPNFRKRDPKRSEGERSHNRKRKRRPRRPQR